MNILHSLPCITDVDRGRPVLFLDKVFLRPRKQNLRGVELFNLGLIRDLARQGVKLQVPIHYSWQDDLSRETTPSPPEMYKLGPPDNNWGATVAGLGEAGRAGSATPPTIPAGPGSPPPATTLPSAGQALNFLCLKVAGRKTLLNGLQAAWRLRRRRYQKIILANVANSVLPALWLLRFFNPQIKVILFAHRLPLRRFLALLPRKSIAVLTVNNIIAASFKRAGFVNVEVFFGHINADKFYPAEKRPGEGTARENKTNFCVVGFLDNAWKGADTAVAAFRAMPADISAKCVLHLASFRSPPSFPEQNIKVYKWLPADAMQEWLRQMDVMIVPSRDEKVMRETFSLVMIEGMLTGLPILAANLPVLAEKINTGGGQVFNTVEELAGLMTLLASKPALRAELGKQSRKIALERYVWSTETFINRYLSSNITS